MINGTTMSLQNTLKNKKILFAATPAAGHFNPLTGLAKYLSDSGNDVRWYTSVDFKDKLSQMKIHHYPFKEALDVNFEDLDSYFPERAKLKSPIDRMNFDMINLFANRSSECFSDISEIYQNFQFDVIICDNTFAAIPILRSKLGVPVVVVGVMPLAEESTALGPYGLGILPPANSLERIKNKLMRFVLKNVLAKKSIQSFKKTLKQYDIEAANTPLLNLLVKQSDLYLQIGSQDFEYSRPDLGSNIRFVGALLPFTEPTTDFWFDKRMEQYSKIILVTQGTVEKNIDNLIIPTLEAFKDSDFLVIVTTGGNKTKELQAKYPMDNIVITDYIPYQCIMPHVHVYITNGGYGGVMQSLKYKLPIVAAGVFEGKSEICSRIGYFNYGIDLKTETPDAHLVKQAVIKIFEDKVYKENVKKLSASFEQTRSEELCSVYIARLLENNSRTTNEITA